MAVATRATERSGYSGKSLATKLGLKPGMRVRLLREPPGYWPLCEFDPATVALSKSGKALDFVHAFCDDRATLARALPGLAAAIAPDGMIWISWRKKSVAPTGDLDENGVRELALPLGLVDIKVCAVDATWSGLKLVWRRERRPG